jgi:hypothetical protein
MAPTPSPPSRTVPMERLFPRQGSLKKEALTGKTIALQPGGALEVPLEGW